MVEQDNMEEKPNKCNRKSAQNVANTLCYNSGHNSSLEVGDCTVNIGQSESPQETGNNSLGPNVIEVNLPSVEHRETTFDMKVSGSDAY